MRVSTADKTKKTNAVKNLYYAVKDGSYKTRLSLLLMGFGQIAEGQILKGIIYLLTQGLFLQLRQRIASSMAVSSL
mgnify:CR=1 FL=1